MASINKHLRSFLMCMSTANLMMLMRTIKRIIMMRKNGKIKRRKQSQLDRDFWAAVSL